MLPPYLVVAVSAPPPPPPPPATTAYLIESRVDAEPLLAYRGFGPGNAEWQQVFNPTWVAASPATGNRSGLLVRSQNCTPPPDSTPGSCGPTCSGTGDRASWLTWAELTDDAGADAAPAIRGRVTAASAVWGPFNCQGWAPHPGGNGSLPEPECVDARGTEDPRLTFDPETSLYTLIYNAWGDHGAYVAAATTADPTTGPQGWTRYGPIFPVDAKIDGWPGKSGSIVLMPSGPHFLIWSCAKMLRITPSIGRSTVKWDANKTTLLFGVRRPPYWDTGDALI